MASNDDLTAAVLFVRAGPRIDTIDVDVAVTETHTGETEVTDHPVETGFAVSDHARPKPDMLTLEGVVSNTPVTPAALAKLRTVDQGFVTLDSTSTVDAIRGLPGFAETAYAALRVLRETGKLITIETGLRVYTNMIMTSLVVPRNSTTGEALRFTAIFKAIRIVSNKLSVATPTKGVNGKKVSTGKKVPKPTDPKTDASSFLYDASKGKGFFGKLAVKTGLVDAPPAE